MSETDRIKARIQQKLVESGEYDRISTLLQQRLLQTGWHDSVKKLANDEVGHDEEPSFTKLNQVLEPKALSMVPEQVRDEILIEIKKFLEKVVEKEL